jgi:hypothetical protein
MLAVPESRSGMVELVFLVNVKPGFWQRNAALSAGCVKTQYFLIFDQVNPEHR